MSLAAELLDRFGNKPVQLVPVTCGTTSPFTVSIYGSTDYIPARAIAGQAFTTGDQGMALWQPPLPPLCFKTT